MRKRSSSNKLHKQLSPLALVIVILIAWLARGDLRKLLPPALRGAATGWVASPSGASADVPARSGDTIRIASFNMQVFGATKLQNAPVMDALVRVVRRFDVVAIQEVRALDDTVLPRFVERINADGSHYDYVIGPRLGRTSSKEQYAVVFDATRIEVDPSSIYTVPDPEDRLHREPLVGRFRVRGMPADQAFTFSLVNIHTDPDETAAELDALADVYTGVQQNGSGEDDVILLGDLNVDDYHLGRLGRLPGITAVVTGVTTNTRHGAQYDNLIFDQRATTEYTGRWGVLDLAGEFKLSVEEALKISDHCPIWAEFRAREASNGPLAAQTSSNWR
jgi:endonuclease/exonuclease/phosphatase family metal-dependent hydrolase